MAPKTVLITGCSEGGIGDALAKEFHRKGLRVFATARNLAKVEHLKELGLEILPLDVIDDASIKQAVESVKSLTGGTLDYLVNNSGSGYAAPLLDTDVSIAKKMFDVNVFAVITVTQAFAPLLIASRGTIINIGSVAGKFPMPWQGYYNASKAAVNLLTSQLRIELAPFNVNAICVITGGIKTKFFENQPPTKVPESSIYYPGREEIEFIENGGVAEQGAWNVDDYAKEVVKNALKKNPKVNHWVGGSAGTIWFAGLLWNTFWDLLLVLPTPFKLIEIKKKIQAAEKSK